MAHDKFAKIRLSIYGRYQFLLRFCDPLNLRDPLEIVSKQPKHLTIKIDKIMIE